MSRFLHRTGFFIYLDSAEPSDKQSVLFINASFLTFTLCLPNNPYIVCNCAFLGIAREANECQKGPRDEEDRLKEG